MSPLRVAGLLAAVCGLVPAQGLDFVREHYTKQEHRIPMRDGVKLFTSVYLPRDKSQAWPILLKRTPYSVGPYGPDALRERLGPSELMARDTYVFVDQDVRGCYQSEGEFVNVRPHRPDKRGPADIDESTDTFDTIEWLVKNLPGHNGKVGMYGISYPGFYVSAGMIDAHPALVAASPQAPIADWFVGDDFRHNGALFLPHAFHFLASFGRPREGPTSRSTGMPVDLGTLDGYQFFLDLGPLANADERHFRGSVAFWNELLRHDTYDEFWQARNLRPHLKGIRPAVLTVGGWFDAEDLFGALETYRSVERQSPGARNTLVMGPWTHGGWSRNDGDALGDVRFGQKTGVFYREQIELTFFRHHLKGAKDPGLPEAYVFATGSNQWHTLDAWPPKDARPLAMFFRPHGALTVVPPTDEGAAFDEYASDPRRPVPSCEAMAPGMNQDYMVADQRFASRRPDVLVWETEPLAEDRTVAGPVTARLHVSTTGTDADFVVKLIDVYPADAPDPEPPASRPGTRARPGASYTRMAGYQQLVRGEPFRGRFRKSFSKPEAFVPGQVEPIEFALPDVFHTFKRGHRLMVQVQSSWFPLVDRNPQTFVPIGRARPEDFQPATHRVWRTKAAPSGITLLVRGGS
jgi:putative CocE/NonD family hydrolase